jgi:ankyrin repeat protein
MRFAAGIAILAIVAALAACGDDDSPAGAPDPGTDQALIEAAADGRTERVRELIDRGADVHARDSGGRTALTAAAFSNQLGAARLLVAVGADVNAKDDTEQSPYLVASSEVGDDPRLLELFLDHGARVDDKDSYNGTALIRAAERGHPRIVRRLLAAGIDRDHVNRLGWTALHEAIVLGDGGREHVATVRVLVEGGVDVNVRGGSGVAPLGHAEERGYDEIVRILRAAGARS